MTPGYLHKERKGEGKYIPSCSISRLLIAIDTRQLEITAAALNIHIFFTSITHKFVENECSCGQNLKYKNNLIYLEFIFMLNNNYQCNMNFFTTWTQFWETIHFCDLSIVTFTTFLSSENLASFFCLLVEYTARKSNKTSLLLKLCVPDINSSFLILNLHICPFYYHYHYHYFYLSSLLKANTVTGMYVLFMCTKKFFQTSNA